MPGSESPASIFADDPEDLVRLLARRSRDPGPRPWLFHPRGIDWRWRSWSQAVDQIARAAEGARRFGTSDRLRGPDRLDADPVLVDLASVVAGLRAEPGPRRTGDEAPIWRRVEEQHRDEGRAASTGDVSPASGPVLPAMRGRLESWVPQVPEAPPRLGTFGWRSADGSPRAATWDDLRARAAELILRLEPDPRADPPILMATGRLDGLPERVLIATSLLLGASLALEPDPAALRMTARRLRPHVVLPPPGVLRELEGRPYRGWARRWNRLRAVLVPEDRARELADLRGTDGVSLPIVAAPWTSDEVFEGLDPRVPGSS